MHKWSQIFRLNFILCLLICISSCSRTTTSTDLDNVDTTNISELEKIQVSLRPHKGATAEVSQIRLKAVKDAALSIGAQGGLAWASERMNARMENDKKYLDSIFNFNAMVLSHGVMPPVLEAGNNSLNLDNPNTIRVADRTYRIVEQAHFATTPPNWREYIILRFAKPQLPDKTLLPKNSYEQAIWREGIHRGWEKGLEQSYSIFQQNLARLKRDFRGMVLYRKLLHEKMISPPFVARTELGVTGDGNDMRINDQVLRIVAAPQLQTNSQNWQTVVVHHE